MVVNLSKAVVDACKVALAEGLPGAKGSSINWPNIFHRNEAQRPRDTPSTTEMKAIAVRVIS